MISLPAFSAFAAERAVCSWGLQRNDWADTAADDLRPDHFEQLAYGALWGVIIEHRRRGRAVKPDTLELWASHRDDWSLGDLIALVSSGEVGSRADFGAHVQAIIDAHEGREIALAIDDMARIVVDEPSALRLDMLSRLEARLRAVRLTSTASVATLGEVVARRAATFNNPENFGLPTGIRELDNRFGGYAKEDFILFAGRPSMGKSALLASSVLFMGRQGFRGHFASAEMSPEQVADRALSAASFGEREAAFQYRDMRSLDQRRRPNEAVVHSLAQAFTAYPIAYDFSPGQSVSHIRREARRTAHRLGGLDFIAVDHTHRLRGEGRDMSAVERFDSIAEGLKNLAREMRVPLIAAAQLNRASEREEDKRPSLSNLRSSGAFEMEADVVVLVHRESYYLARKEPQRGGFDDTYTYQKAWDAWNMKMLENQGKLELHTAKQRQGESGIDTVHFAEGYDVIRSPKESAA